MNAVVSAQEGRAVSAYTAKDIVAQVQRIQEVMQAVMKEGTHYGKIPGTDKQTLYKPGSEVLLTTFHISCEPEVEDLSSSDEIRYRVRARAVHQTSGILMGVGVGEASSNEEKYKWRRAVCDEEFAETPVDRRREKWVGGRQGAKPYQIKQIRTSPADHANTILKMAKKRAQIDMTLTALAASDIFTQDLEEEPGDDEAGRGDGQATGQRQQSSKAGTSQPQSTGKGRGLATTKQVAMVNGRLDQGGIREVDFLAAMNITAMDQLPFDQVNSALEWIKANSP